MNRAVLALTLLLGLLSSVAARASLLPYCTPRELVARADTVIRAAPVDPAMPTRFRVTGVLLGTGLSTGDVVLPSGMNEYHLQGYFRSEVLEDRIANPCRPVAALLYLQRQGRGWTLVPSGLRLLNETGQVLAPGRWANPSRYELVAQTDLRWADLLGQVRADCATVRRLMASRDLPRTDERNRALLAWVVEHRREFGNASGWEPLEERIFTWVLAGRRLGDSWAVVRMFAELHDGRLVPLRTPAFSTRAGRDFLLRQAEAEGLQGDRVRALAILALPLTLRPTAGADGVTAIDDREHADVTARLARLLKDRVPGVRGAAARALQAVEVPPGHKSRPAAAGALAALEEAYKAEASGLAREDLAAAVHALAGPDRWQKLTGNPHALFARLQDFEREHGKLAFCLHLQSDGVRVHECPTVRLERLGWVTVAEKKEVRLEVANPPDSWEQGWTGEPMLSTLVSLHGLQPGTWRVSVCGTAGKGKDKVSWVSEPRILVLEAPAAGQRGFAVDRPW
jgi:hypothetical protein